MKLINANALEKAIYEWMPKDQETWMDSKIPPIENLVVSIMMTIQEQQPVDAIPIEWIKEYIRTHPASTDIYFKWMIDEWKDEQEKQK